MPQMRVDTEALRTFAKACDDSRENVLKVHGGLGSQSYIRDGAWDGGGMTSLLDLQGALDLMRQSYNVTREVVLGRLWDFNENLGSTDQRLREAANEYEQVDEDAREDVQLWP